MAKTNDAWQERTAVLLGDERLATLSQRHVLIVGVGGVGGAAAEMLCRAGIGRLTLIDADAVAASNINRQLPALHSTVGRLKVDVLRQRFEDINPAVIIETRAEFVSPDTVAALLTETSPDFVVDAIDTIQPKVALIAHCLRHRVPIISSLGAGAKTDITQIRFSNLWDTYHCGLGKAVRKGLTAEGLKWKKLPVVFCAQQADPDAIIRLEGERNKKTSAGTVSYMPATFGCFLAQHVIMHIK